MNCAKLELLSPDRLEDESIDGVLGDENVENEFEHAPFCGKCGVLLIDDDIVGETEKICYYFCGYCNTYNRFDL